MKSAHERAAYLRQHFTAGKSAAGGSVIKKSTDLEKFQRIKGVCASIAMKACRRRQQFT